MNKGEVAKRLVHKVGMKILFALNGGRNMGRVLVGRLFISPLGVALKLLSINNNCKL